MTYYNGVCFQDQELQKNSGWLTVRTSALSRSRFFALHRAIDLEDIYVIIEAFLIGDLFSTCCHDLCGRALRIGF